MKQHLKISIFLFLLFTSGKLFSQNIYEEFYKAPVDIPAESITAEELASFQTMKAAYIQSLKTNPNADAAIVYADGIINGTTSVTDFTHTQLATMFTHAATLARAALSGNAVAQGKLNEMINKMIGSNATLFSDKTTYTISTSDYGNVKLIAQGCVESCAAYQPSNALYKKHWINFCYKISQYGVVFIPNYAYNLNTDWMHNLAESMFNFPFVLTDDNTLGTQHLKACSRFLNRFVEITDGDTDGQKIDGTYFHHATHYPNYLYCFRSWHNLIYRFKGTPFRVSKAAFEGGKRHDMCMLLLATKPATEGSYLANSLAGRNPYDKGGPNNQVSQQDFQYLLEVGKDINDVYDEDLAQAYNYFYDFTSSSYSNNVGKLDGFYQFNYSPTGVLRKRNWVATMRAPTTKFWGSEQYAVNTGANRFGRYQSHGTLEIMYKGSRQVSGVPSTNNGAGWDWNVVPGTTTVHYTKWLDMMPGRTEAIKIKREQRFDQKNKKDFSGALAMGNTGIYATDFVQGDDWGSQVYAPTDLRFKKSYFAFDSIIIALGSNISSNGSVPNTGNTATNLFQNVIYSGISGNFIHNGNTISATQNAQTAAGSSNWFVTPAGTGYYVPSKHRVTVVYGTQKSPNQNGDNYDNESLMGTLTAAKAYIDHGKTPTNENYEFVVIPGVTSIQMTPLKTKLDNATNPIYSIIQQDSFAHILRHNGLKQTGYVVFKPLQNLTQGLVKSVDATSLIYVKETDKDTIQVALCSPDLNIKVPSVYGFTSEDKTIKVTLKGGWNLKTAQENVTIWNEKVDKDTITVIQTVVSKGLTKTMSLYKTKELVENPTGITRAENNLLKIFPNPFQDRIRVVLEQPLQSPTTVVLYNTSGSLVKKSEWKYGEQIDIDVKELQPGVYYLYCEINGRKVTQAVMKRGM